MSSQKIAIPAIRKIIYEHFCINAENLSESQRINYTDLMMQSLNESIGEIKKKEILKQLEDENALKLETLEKELINKYENKEKQNYIKNLASFLFDGIIIATLVGLIINQLTDVFSELKLGIQNSVHIPTCVTSIIIIILLVIFLALILAKHFLDKIKTKI
ncbi:hypothetical protein IR152_18595 [Clostridioides sp. ES-S-0108-01]|uniref:hypothetical protein n=1 Tax=Clostridioides sp. ES-S-0108-01 TaxID=2770773 RepID=UPI001D0C623B|nr:hypothetical protein [Clostridioides sp. ES-S-0108-01]MCI9975614.1 hypothetical protein [Clostridioides difficile]UDN52428.1 hypothetical protein JJC16_07205 [Clostridioides sp. ES-S-0107-01]